MNISINEFASKKIRSEMKLRDVTTAQICKLLKDTFDISLNAQSFNNKMSRANFSATFFFQCMYVLKVRNIAFEIESVKAKINKKD